MAIIRRFDNTFEIIDGKQRLSSMISFYKNEFTLIIEDKEYFFHELPKDYQLAISNYWFAYLIVNEDYENEITDKEKIEWFKFINFVGTPQEKKHIENLTI